MCLFVCLFSAPFCVSVMCCLCICSLKNGGLVMVFVCGLFVCVFDGMFYTFADSCLVICLRVSVCVCATDT